MILAIIAAFSLALAAPWIHARLRGLTGWVLALLPAALTAYFLAQAPAVVSGRVVKASAAWVPSLGIRFSFFLDGLSLLFALLICGIGALILVYAGGYLAGHAQLGRFHGYLLMFLASMLGLVTADNLITLFVFWELTSLASYFLIGFDHARERARSAALQALLVTGGGGLALLAGFVLIAQAAGTYELTEIIAAEGALRAHALYAPMVLLTLAGAFTKSAQFPFHFWLPNAMEAPTPVSAYLHSATMVKAGVYLLARLNPALGSSNLWSWTLILVGAATMITGALLAFRRDDLKQVLAHSTVSALGGLVLLIGVGTPLSIKAAMLFLLAHALYKGALFLVAGIVDHETGVREMSGLGGLARKMPIVTACAALAALSMAGLPPLLGFIGKEILYEANLAAPSLAPLATGSAVMANAFIAAVAAIFFASTFLGQERAHARNPHDPVAALWLGPAILASLGLLMGLAPQILSGPISSAVAAVSARPAAVKLTLWHGLSPAFGLSALTLLAAAGVFRLRAQVRVALSVADRILGEAPNRVYEWSVGALNALGRANAALLQSGYLRVYLLTVISCLIGLVGVTLFVRGGAPVLGSLGDVRIYEWASAALVIVGALTAVRSKSRLAAAASLGAVGYGVALIYTFFGAPDLAMTQFLVETFTVILFVLVFYHLPRFALLSGRVARMRDAAVAILAGGLMTSLVLAASLMPAGSHMTSYFVNASLNEAHGRNVVNVILVDFRSLDTLGEITVLSVAAVGVLALLKLRGARRG